MIATEGDSGRSIAAVPLGHVLLMPRSLFILTGSLYSSHLHGIAARERDSFIAPEREEAGTPAAAASDPSGAGEADSADGADALPHSTPKAKAEADVVANASLLGLDALPRDAFTYERDTRVSLTFRHANKVLKGGAFGLAMGGLRRK
jgi:alkylated DNA repair protein alkB family protein 6